jgi:hypothetical protein
MPEDIEACVKALEGKEGVSEPYALCNWMKSEGKGYFAHGEAFDVGAAAREFADQQRQKGAAGEIILPKIHLMTEGPWQGNWYGPREFDEMIANFRRFSSGSDPLVENPAVIGHEEDQLEFTGLPAVGWIKRLYREGPELYCDASQVFPDIADLIEAGAYKHVSPEIYPPDKLPEGVPARGHMLRRVAFLGGELPHIKQLADLPRPVRLSERDLRPRRTCPTRLHVGRRLWHADAGAWACFSEVIKMADDAVEQIATAAIKQEFPRLPDALIESFTPEQMKMVAEAIGGGAPPETPPGEGEPPVPGMVEWPAGLDRQAVEAELVGMGEDQAALAAMTDDDLLALYQQKTGGSATPMSEPPPPEPPVDEPPPEEEPVSIPMPTPAPAPAARRQPAKVTVTQQFSERRLATLERRLKAAETLARRQEQAARQRLAEEQRGQIRAFCERLVRDGRLSPAQVDMGRDGLTPTGPAVKALYAADAVRKFSDGKTALQLQMEAYEALPPRRFGEQVPDPIQGNAGGALAPERERQLLSYTRAGRRLLAERARQEQSHRAFAETLGQVIHQRVNGRG